MQDKEQLPVDAENGSSSPNKRKTFIYIAVAIVIGLVVNIFMGLLMDGSKIWGTVSSVSIWLILLPFLAYMCVSIVDALRLFLVSRKCGHQLGFLTCIMNSMVGTFFAHVTPLAMGGQPFQIYHLHRHGMTTRMATNIIFSRFVVNAMILVLILILGIPVILGVSQGIAGVSVIFWFGLCVTVLFAIFFLIVLIQPHIISWLTSHIAHTAFGRLIGRLVHKPDWQSEFESYTQGVRDEVRFLWSEGLGTMIVDILLNFVDLCLLAFALWLPLNALVSTDISFLQVLVIYNAVWQVVFYIPSPGASGGLEGMFTLVFSSMAHKPETALVAIVIWRFSTYYLSLVPGMIASSFAFKTKAARQAASISTSPPIQESLNE